MAKKKSKQKSAKAKKPKGKERDVVVLVGTRKGAFLLRSNAKRKRRWRRGM